MKLKKTILSLFLACLLAFSFISPSLALGDYQSLSLNGSGWASITDGAQQGLDFGLSDFMIEGWVKRGSVYANWVGIMGKGTRLGIYLESVGWAIEIGDGATYQKFPLPSLSSASQTGRWECIALVVDRSGNVYSFLDGAQKDSIVVTLGTTILLAGAGAFEVGKFWAGDTFTGLLDEFRIWNFGYGGLPADYATYIAWRHSHPSHDISEYSAGAWNGYADAYRVERITFGALDDDNSDFEGAGADGTDIEVGTDWVKSNTSAEIDNEAGSGVTSYNGSDFCAKIHTATGNTPSLRMDGVNLDAAFTVGDWYELSYDYKLLNCTDARVRILNAGSATDVNKILTSTSWASDSFVFQVVGNNDMYLLLYSHYGTDEDGTEVVWIDNVSIREIGNVAHYMLDGDYTDQTTNANTLTEGGTGNAWDQGVTPCVVTEGVVISGAVIGE